MNIAGLGIDAVNIERFRKAATQRGQRFLNRIFTPAEIEYVNAKHLRHMHMAGRFAAKEAVKKALPEGASIGLNWKNIEIKNGSDGKPYAVLHGPARELKDRYSIIKVLVSISHTRDLAVSNAMVVMKNGS